MARGINKSILVGHFGQDPESRFTPEGKRIINASLATGREWKDRQTGKKQERTEWHRLVFFEPLSNIVDEYVRKGYLLYIEGYSQTRPWTDQGGTKRYTTEVVVEQMEILRSAKEDQSENTSATEPEGFSDTPAESFDDDVPY